MRFSLATLALPVAVQAAHFSKSEYASGAVHQKLMKLKADQWENDAAQGKQDPLQWKSWKAMKGANATSVPCKDGLAVVEAGNANQTFRSNRWTFTTSSAMPTWVALKVGEALLGAGGLQTAASLPLWASSPVLHSSRSSRMARCSTWAVFQRRARVRDGARFESSMTMSLSAVRLVGLFSDLPIGRTHNVVVDWDNEYILAVGAQPRNQTCKAGLQYIDFSNPSKPSSPGCSSQDGYVHDAQCVTYNGPDRRYRGRNICIGYNEDTMTVYDSTSKDGNPASEILSTLSYPGATYCHQGWWTESNWHQYVLLNDELDEVEKVGPGASGRPVTHIVDLTDLRNPKATGTFFATDQKAIDHNLYIVDGLAYQSNYGAGIWVHDVSSISKDSTGKDVTVEGFFDIYPEDDAQGGVVEFVGTWSHFLFPSGYILVNTIERGAFTVKLASGRGAQPGPGHGGKSTGRGRARF